MIGDLSTNLYITHILTNTFVFNVHFSTNTLKFIGDLSNLYMINMI